ncbi:hypothetical protein VTI74DRAFT_779 [Chaetomium olivicolor]
MQRQGEAQTTPAPAPQPIEAAPPAYTPVASSPNPPDANNTASEMRAPVKGLPNLPADQNLAKPLPMPPQQPILGVTPLNILGDQPQWIDCPFCQRRTMTRIGKEGTPMQLIAGALCCLFCVCLACVPCIAGWFEETKYYCSQCHKKVAMRSDRGAITVYGPSMVVPSKYA